MFGRFIIRTLSFMTIMVFFTSCNSLLDESSRIVVINDYEFKKKVNENLKKVIKEQPDYTPYSELKKQSSRSLCSLVLPTENSQVMTPREIYQKALDSTVTIGNFYHCSSKKCKRFHFDFASGVIIHPAGIILTNYHVFDSSKGKKLGMAAATSNGKVYLVDEVLAASKDDDFVVLKLRNADGLPAVPITSDEPVGNPVTVVSHPNGQFYTLTQGYISRYKMKKNIPIMNITADYAKGSSGGPVFNNRGNLVGLVSSTFSICYVNVPLAMDEEEKTLSVKKKGEKVASYANKPLVMQNHHQMTIKNCVPSRSILKAFEK